MADEVGGRVPRQPLARGVDRSESALQVEDADHLAGVLEEEPVRLDSRVGLGIRRWIRCAHRLISALVGGDPAFSSPIRGRMRGPCQAVRLRSSDNCRRDRTSTSGKRGGIGVAIPNLGSPSWGMHSVQVPDDPAFGIP